MSNETLRVRLGLIGDMVMMQVVTMPASYRGVFLFVATNGITVRSGEGPDLERQTCWLQGNDEELDDEAVCYYAQRGTGFEMYDELKQALLEAKEAMIVGHRRMLAYDATRPIKELAFDTSDVI